MPSPPGNRPTGAEAFVRSLQAQNVDYIFGLCGDTTLPLYDALFRLDHGITHILTRDERSAAYMADGYARVTGWVCAGNRPGRSMRRTKRRRRDLSAARPGGSQ